MKRKIILSSIIAILLVSLMAFGQGKKETTQQLETTKVESVAKDTDSEQKKDETENETENETPKTNNDVDNNKVNVTEQSNTNIFINEQPMFNENCVNINPGRVYYDGDSLVLEAYVTNGLNSTVHNIEVGNITLSNKSGVIASDKFGAMKDASIGPHQYIKWTFKFPAASIKKQNADLNYLYTKNDTRYKY